MGLVLLNARVYKKKKLDNMYESHKIAMKT